MTGLILLSQHLFGIILGIPIIGNFYLGMIKEERNKIVKFGDSYKSYMDKVPRANLLIGVYRLYKKKNNR
jgi:protein-S-isoprenylcysteine O-methyltransferase Ste14